MAWHQTVIQGNLGKDPELKTLDSGSDVADFSVAVTPKWTSDGEKHEHTEWYNCKVFGKQAEVCEKYLHKGDSVLLTGRMRTRTYEKDGETKYVSRADRDFQVSLLDNRGRDNGGDEKQPARAEKSRVVTAEPRPPVVARARERGREQTQEHAAATKAIM